MFLQIKNSQHASLFLLVLASSIFSARVSAIDPNSSLPIQIESDRATLNDETGISNYAGNVIISQGLSRLEADNISVNAIDRKVVSIKATGNPAHFIQQDDAASSSTHGYGKTIIYIAKESLLKFMGEARLVQKDNSFAGEQIEYDITRKAIKASGDESIGSRVKIQYHPNSTQNIEPSPKIEETTNQKEQTSTQIQHTQSTNKSMTHHDINNENP